MTIEFCNLYCYALNYQYAGVEFGTQCFCGSAPSASLKVPMSECNQRCGGNSSETCGAADRVQVSLIKECKNRRVNTTYCNPALPDEVRVKALIASLSLEEKVQCMQADNPNCTSIMFTRGIFVNQLHKESLHGLRYPCVKDVFNQTSPVCASSFPHAQLLAASFNRSLWDAVGTAISTEARAFFNLYWTAGTRTGWHALSFWAPDINLCRDPRWGRCVEVPGEDPILTGEYARHYVKAMQVQDSDGVYKTLANAKHFSAYDVEYGKTSQGQGQIYNRGSFNAIVTKQDAVETYLPQFQTANKAANLGGAMCSYNAVNGVPSCANSLFTNTILRDLFNFTGMIVSDAGAVHGIGPGSHNYSQTTDGVCASALHGGTDLNLGQYYGSYMLQAAHDNAVSMDDIDQALTRIVSQYLKTGLLNPKRPWTQFGLDDIDTNNSRKLALDGARQGFVLLKNEGNVLPLKPTSDGNVKVAILGPHGNSSTCMLGNYYGENDLVFTQTPLFGFQRRPDVDVVGYAQGCELSGNVTSGFAEAVTLAKQSEVAIVFLGLTSGQGKQVNNTPAMEREGFDRTFLTMPGVQNELVEAIAATGVPVVVVLINSGGLDASWIYDNIPAVLEAFYPGEMGGDALASVIMGDVSPSGRLPTTIYKAGLTAKRNITDMLMRLHVDEYGQNIPGITYRFAAPSDLLFSFGYGQTYSTFNFALSSNANKTTTTSALAAAWPQYYTDQGVQGLPSYTIKVTNTGHFASDIVVLGFVDQHGLDTPRQQLFGFERVLMLSPGASAAVNFTVPPQAIAVVDADGTQTIRSGIYSLRFGGDPDGFDQASLIVSGDSRQVFEFPR
eukprot:m.198250 g.198250  ORF g.198250 m.198250 type:complete len:840 (-) comp25890_c1_seq10:30-2549(-)